MGVGGGQGMHSGAPNRWRNNGYRTTGKTTTCHAHALEGVCALESSSTAAGLGHRVLGGDVHDDAKPATPDAHQLAPGTQQPVR
jgi:hypothetical protein